MSAEITEESCEIDVNYPLMRETPYQSPSQLFKVIADEPWAILLDSADSGREAYGTNRYSYIGFDPFKKVLLKNNQFIVDDETYPLNDIFRTLKQISSKYMLNKYSNKSPFQGGLMGLLSYDLCQHLESIPPSKYIDEDLEVVSIGFYDLVHAFDHKLKKSWVFSSGLPHTNSQLRTIHARNRLDEYFEKIQSSHANRVQNKLLADCHSNFTHPEYIATVNDAIDYIKAGDIFEVNLSQRFEAELPKGFNTYGLYQSIIQHNPSPFSAYFNLGNTKVISSSPERFIEVKQGLVETRPIKGTRKRSKDELEDQNLAQELINSEKDRAENVMIVDLMRNDLSHVCESDSVVVPKICSHEVYPHVHHLVSVVQGKLREDKTIFDLLKAAFPGGSITGAPKIRAMQIISELEPHQRGPYCGSLFHASFDGQSMDSSILIRTYVVKDQKITFHGGGAVTIASDAEEEYKETLNKVAALQYVLENP